MFPVYSTINKASLRGMILDYADTKLATTRRESNMLQLTSYGFRDQSHIRILVKHSDCYM